MARRGSRTTRGSTPLPTDDAPNLASDEPQTIPPPSPIPPHRRVVGSTLGRLLLSSARPSQSPASSAGRISERHWGWHQCLSEVQKLSGVGNRERRGRKCGADDPSAWRDGRWWQDGPARLPHRARIPTFADRRYPDPGVGRAPDHPAASAHPTMPTGVVGSTLGRRHFLSARPAEFPAASAGRIYERHWDRPALSRARLRTSRTHETISTANWYHTVSAISLCWKGERCGVGRRASGVGRCPARALPAAWRSHAGRSRICAEIAPASCR